MCGIVGFVGEGSEHHLQRMITAIGYRGPDDKGIFWQRGIGLGHARLSILDLSPAGHQPMFTGDKSVGVVFNGEIYNYAALRQLLEPRGYVFKSQSDTEVILYLYKEHGEECFEYLNGMFAIALYDFEKKELLLARDRMGKKPLYWMARNGTIIFASEPKGMFAHPLMHPELDRAALSKYLLYEYVPTPHCIYQNLQKLPPATCLKWSNGLTEAGQFWQLDCKEKDSTFAEASDGLEKVIESAVKDRLVADVPVGVFLSGGLDSSAVTYFAQKNSAKKIKTFSIGFKEKSFDESSYARDVANHLGTDHVEHVVSMEEMRTLIPKVLAKLDEPLADPSLVPTYLLSTLTRQHVTVALGGDGGDELFAGYPMFQAEQAAKVWAAAPELIKKGVSRIASLVPASYSNLSLDFKLKQFLRGFKAGEEKYRHQRWLASFTPEEQQELLNPEILRQLAGRHVYEDLDYYFDSIPGTEMNQLLGVYQRTYLMDGVMVKVDRASMYNALETRAPLLDYRVVEYANHLPYNFKFRRGQGKYIFKKMMEGKLPHHIIHRPKKGFGMPIGEWLRKELRPWCEEMLSHQRIKEGGYFNPQYIDRIKQEHFEGKHNHYKKLWTLLVFETWRDNYLK